MWFNGSLINAKDCIIPSFPIEWCLNSDSLELVKVYNQLDGKNWKTNGILLRVFQHGMECLDVMAVSID